MDRTSRNETEEEDNVQNSGVRNMGSPNEHRQRYNSFLNTVKKFFKNNPLRKSAATRLRLNENRNTAVNDRSTRRTANEYFELPVTNRQNDRRGSESGINTNNETSVTNGQQRLETPVNNSNGNFQSYPHTSTNAVGNGSSPLQTQLPQTSGSTSDASSHIYDTVRLPPTTKVKKNGQESESSNGDHQVINENHNPEIGTENSGRTEDGPIENGQQDICSTSSQDVIVSTEIPKPRFNIEKFIEYNARKQIIPNLQSGGVVLLNVKGTGVQFEEFASDIEPIQNNTATHERLSNQCLMCGGIVVFKEFSKSFNIPNIYHDDPVIVIDEIPDNLEVPETYFEIPTISKCVLASSCSGGSIIDDGSSVGATLPQLFTVKKPPPNPPLHRPFSGGTIIKPEVSGEIIYDVLSQRLRYRYERK